MKFTGKTVEEATEAGLKELGISAEDAVIKVLEEPVKGIFGKLKSPAVVEVEKKPCGLEKAAEVVQGILDFMDVVAKAEVVEDAPESTINIIAENSSSVIGYRGEVLDAIQTIAGAIANIGGKDYKKVVVDCEGYRVKRNDTLISLAHKLEAKATEMRREVMLEPMSPYERRIIHTALAGSETVTTSSEGKEPNRYVLIIPNDKDENSTPYNAGRKGGERRSDGGRRNGLKRFDKDNDRRRGGRNNGRRKSGFTADQPKRKPSSGFGTYLGNSFKDNI